MAAGDVRLRVNAWITEFDPSPPTPPTNCDIYITEHFWRKFQTTDASNNAYSFSDASGAIPPSECIGMMEVSALARKADGSLGATYHKRIAFRATAGSFVQLGTTQDVTPNMNDAGAAAWSLTLNVTATVVQVVANGAAATTIDWLLHIKMLHMSNIT